MRLFLDTNVLVDHALIRKTGRPYEAEFILDWAAYHEIPMFVSPGCIYTFVYLLQKHGIKEEALKQQLSFYLEVLNISHVDSQCFADGLQSDFTDVEDSFQYFSALRSNCDFLLTTNLTDFRCADNANITVTSPLNFLITVLKKQKGIDF
ncbi:MAG: PIN domain-containing protein [Dyadobacter sp.]|uniref:type II toxin-antitoxin system VapC family toxin n=1 Tax=Dyadobacter sp. TaxID=1914288 RepID=UPI001B1D662B|nr:PIN domain-containing protein [Dyadobacter sp.]MBO9612797.1 PIN domain-containing protein [Dyadobacter sp.]